MSDRLTDSQITEGLRLDMEPPALTWQYAVLIAAGGVPKGRRMVAQWDAANRCAWLEAHYAAALAEVQALRGQVEWVPVADRLPVVGRAVLATFRNSLGNVRVVRALYTDGREAVIEDEDGEPCPAGWYENNEYEETHWRLIEPVEFWMALPKSPLSVEVSR